MKHLSLWLAKRLISQSHGKRSTVRTGAVIAVAGVAFALAIMEITLAVTSGFKEGITSKLQGFVASVTVSPALNDGLGGRKNTVTLTPDLLAPLTDLNAEIVPLVIQPGMLKTDDDFAAIVLRGYEADYSADFEKSNIKDGGWLSVDDRHGIVVSTTVASRLGLKVGDRIAGCFFNGEKVKYRPFVIKGIYESGLSEFDDVVAYASADILRTIGRLKNNEASAVEVRGIPTDSVNAIGERLAQKYIDNAVMNSDPSMAYNVETIRTQGAIYLSWLDLLNTNVVVIFILMALVAISTLLSSLFIQVLEKVNAIGLLRAMGATNRFVSRIFIYISLRLVGVGLIIGNVIGLGFVYVQSTYRILHLDPDMYYLNYVPVQIDALTIVLLNLAVIVAVWLVLILPARIATRMSPAHTLRFD